MEELALLTKLIFVTLFLLFLISSFFVYVFFLFKKRLEELDLQKELDIQRNNLANLEAILAAQERERKRIADDLHDEIGATLSLVQKNLSYVKKKQNSIDSENDELSHSINLLNSSIQSIRDISKELTPTHVVQLGLSKAIVQHLELVSNATISKCDFETNIQNELKIHPDHSIELYRIYLELVTNIIKHSNATKMLVKCLQNEANFELIITHDGTGLTNAGYREKQIQSKGLGLKSVSNRVRRIGASIHFEKKEVEYEVKLQFLMIEKT